MDLNVERIPGQLRINPDAGGQERQRKREQPAPKRSGDSVSISDEARKRSLEGEGGEEEPGA